MGMSDGGRMANTAQPVIGILRLVVANPPELVAADS